MAEFGIIVYGLNTLLENCQELIIKSQKEDKSRAPTPTFVSVVAEVLRQGGELCLWLLHNAEAVFSRLVLGVGGFFSYSGSKTHSTFTQLDPLGLQLNALHNRHPQKGCIA